MRLPHRFIPDNRCYSLSGLNPSVGQSSSSLVGQVTTSLGTANGFNVVDDFDKFSLVHKASPVASKTSAMSPQTHPAYAPEVGASRHQLPPAQPSSQTASWGQTKSTTQQSIMMQQNAMQQGAVHQHPVQQGPHPCGHIHGSFHQPSTRQEIFQYMRIKEKPSVMGALDIARETEEGAADPKVREILDEAISRIWGKLTKDPNHYLLTRDEFSIFNYYQGTYGHNEIARAARKRFWDNYEGDGHYKGNQS
ncbi:hypothetical protein QBC34DRAFT_377450 [Podospora aff. communis PSN243]|uniref:Uncharacterized protein n=1 Tax=Podospora aff. communis PSN243 TaxID=3040156 RepID=A0AAV9GVX7_9PEZI|nr:hypothetical protein QBC34DRAFT_377450 [Podospora aff. communis PSN243]